MDIEPKTPTGMPILAVIVLVVTIALGIYAIRQMAKKSNFCIWPFREM